MLKTVVAPIVEYAILAWFAGVALTIGYRIWSGHIVTVSLIKVQHTDSFSFHRLQMMAVTLCFCAGYILIAFARGSDQSMPDISPPLLAALFGSHATYLGGKLLSQ